MIERLADEMGAGLRTFGVAVLLGAFGLAGAGFLVAAGWTALAGAVGPAAASAVVGLVLLLPPLAGIGLWVARHRPGERRALTRSEIDCARVAFALASEIGERLARRRGRR